MFGIFSGQKNIITDMAFKQTENSRLLARLSRAYPCKMPKQAPIFSIFLYFICRSQHLRIGCTYYTENIITKKLLSTIPSFNILVIKRLTSRVNLAIKGLLAAAAPYLL